LRTYLRLDTTPRTQIAAKLDLSDLTLENLLQAAREIFHDKNNLPPLSEVVSFPRVTIRDKIKVILDKLQKEGGISFSKLVGKKGNRVDVVVTFLAMLELVKRHIVGATQDTLFGDIELISEGELAGLEDQDLGFVE
jgi:segregation and condensation protein A